MSHRPSRMDFLKQRNAQLEAQIAAGMSGQTQRVPSRGEKVAGTVTQVRHWAQGWRKQLTDLLEQDAAVLTENQATLLRDHLSEVEDVYARATKVFARMLEAEIRLESSTAGVGMVESARRSLAALEPDVDAELLELEQKIAAAKGPSASTSAEAVVAAIKEAAPTSNVILLPGSAVSP